MFSGELRGIWQPQAPSWYYVELCGKVAPSTWALGTKGKKIRQVLKWCCSYILLVHKAAGQRTTSHAFVVVAWKKKIREGGGGGLVRMPHQKRQPERTKIPVANYNRDIGKFCVKIEIFWCFPSETQWGVVDWMIHLAFIIALDW